MSQLPDLASHSSGLTEEGYISVEKGGLGKSNFCAIFSFAYIVYVYIAKFG